MLYFNRISVSERIDFNKTIASKKCDICHYWYFLNFNFNIQVNICNRCHDLLMISMNLSDIAILIIKGSDYRCSISLISKKEVINIIQSGELTKESEYIKMGTEVLTLKLKKVNFMVIRLLFFGQDVDIDKVLVSNKISLGEKSYKYFIGYLCNNDKVRPLHITLPKIGAYVKSYDGETKWMYFLIEDDDLSERYNIIRDKFSADLKKNLITSLPTVKNI